MHAFIIKGDFLTAHLIENRLLELGFTSFAFAMDEEEAIAAASKRCPDLITSDVQLSAGCGIDAVQRICDQKPIPVIYITGSAMQVRERCPLAVVIQKPFGMAIPRGVKRPPGSLTIHPTSALAEQFFAKPILRVVAPAYRSASQ